MNEQVYLSHRWVGDDLSNTGKNLREWAGDFGFEVKVDKFDADEFRPIDEFITDLTHSSGTIFLLTEDFFDSKWCMTEICEHYFRWGAFFHSLYIPCDSWQVEDPQNFLEEKKLESIRRFPPDKVPPEHQPAFAMIGELFDDLKQVNFQSGYLEEQGEKLWGTLKQMKERDKLLTLSPSLDQFEKANRLQIERHLGECPELVTAMDCRNSLDAVDQLFAETDPRVRLQNFYHSCRSALERVSARKKTQLKRAIEQMCFSLFHYLIDHQEGIKRTTVRSVTVMNETIELVESRRAIVHLVVLTTMDPGIAKRSLEFEGNNLVIAESQAIHESKIVRSSSYEQGRNYMQVLVDIFKVLLPDERLENDHYLTQREKLELRGKLEDEFGHGRAVYITVNSGDPKHPLNELANVRRLKNDLPHLIVVRVGVDDIAGLLHTNISERRVTDLMKNFAELLH